MSNLTHMTPCLLSRRSQVRVLPRLPNLEAIKLHNLKVLPVVRGSIRIPFRTPKTGQMLAVSDRSGPRAFIMDRSGPGFIRVLFMFGGAS